MERSMGSRKAMRERAVAETRERTGHAVSSGDTQFYTDSCPRCAGLLVNEWSYDLCNEGAHNAKLLRCVQCGYRIDRVILQNQRRTTMWQICPVSTSMSVQPHNLQHNMDGANLKERDSRILRRR